MGVRKPLGSFEASALSIDPINWYMYLRLCIHEKYNYCSPVGGIYTITMIFAHIFISPMHILYTSTKSLYLLLTISVLVHRRINWLVMRHTLKLHAQTII